MFATVGAPRLAARQGLSLRPSGRRTPVVTCSSSRERAIQKRLRQREERLHGEAAVVYKTEAGKPLTSQNILKAQAESRVSREWTGEEYETLASVTEGVRESIGLRFGGQAGAQVLSATAEHGDATAAGTTGAGQYDVFRDSPLRYMGYANEVGEALAAFLPVGGVPFSYAVAISYVLADTAHKAYLEWALRGCDADDAECTVMDKKLRFLLAGSLALDTVVWQMLASVIIPGATIHYVVQACHAALVLGDRALLDSIDTNELAAAYHSLLANGGERWIPTSTGLAAIPFIVRPIDNGVHKLLDISVRPFIMRSICSSKEAAAYGLEMCEVDWDADL
eukprot:scaffold1946_cov397-Prasinococcus_capsulatus_cf.AAC.4